MKLLEKIFDIHDANLMSDNDLFDLIKKSYRKLSMKYHPDKYTGPDKKEAEIQFKLVNAAYEYLKEEKNRIYYRANYSSLDKLYDENNQQSLFDIINQATEQERSEAIQKVLRAEDINIIETPTHNNIYRIKITPTDHADEVYSNLNALFSNNSAVTNAF